MANLFQPSLVRVTNENGDPVSGARLYFYQSETNTLAVVYSDEAGTVPTTNPIIADASGLFPDPAYVDGGITYRVRLTNANDALIWEVEPVRGFDESSATNAITVANAAVLNTEASATEAQGSADAADASAASSANSAAISQAAADVAVATLDGHVASTVAALPAPDGTQGFGYIFFGADEGVYEDTGVWTRRGDTQALRARIAADEARSDADTIRESAFVEQRFGIGTAIATNLTFGVTNTLVPRAIVPAGTKLDTLAISIATAGAGAMGFKFAEINANGTFDIIDLDSKTTTATGAVTFALTKDGAPYTTARAGHIAFRREGASSPVLNYRNGGSMLQSGSNVTGSGQSLANVVWIVPYALTAQVPESVADNAARIAELEGAVSADAPVVFRQGSFEAAIGQTFGSYQFYTATAPIERTGKLVEIASPPITVAGGIEIGLFSPVGNEWKLERVIGLNAAALGVNEFSVADGDFGDNILVRKGWRHAVRSLGATYSYGSGKGACLQFPANTQEGAGTFVGTPIAFAFSIGIGIETQATPLSVLASKFGDRLRGTTRLTHEAFAGTATPAGWALGGWTVNNGLTSPAGGALAMAEYAVPEHATRHGTQIRFRIDQITSTAKFGITGTSNAQYVRINTATQQVEIATRTSSPTARAVRDIGFTAPVGSVVGREYTLTVTRHAHRVTIALRDCKTGERLDWSIKAMSLGRITGKRGILFDAGAAGDITVRWVNLTLGGARWFHALFVGDSNTEGFYSSDLDMPTWAERLDAIRNKGDTLTSAQFATTSVVARDQMNAVLSEVEQVEYVCVLIGTNDTVQAVLDANLTGICADIVAAGAVPVLMTLPPKSGGLYVQTNTNIRNGVYGSHAFIDVAAALTTNNDGINWAPGMNADAVHLSGAGHAALIAADASGQPVGRIASDAPFLFA